MAITFSIDMRYPDGVQHGEGPASDWVVASEKLLNVLLTHNDGAFFLYEIRDSGIRNAPAAVNAGATQQRAQCPHGWECRTEYHYNEFEGPPSAEDVALRRAYWPSHRQDCQVARNRERREEERIS